MMSSPGSETLDPEFDELDVSDVELIQHVRETGEVLHADALGSEGRPIGGWYNPAPFQRSREQQERDDELRARTALKERIEHQRREREQALASALAREHWQRQRVKRELEHQERARQMTAARYAAEQEAHEKQNAHARVRAMLERECWAIAQEVAEQAGASDTEARLMWNMLRYQNLGAGRGKQWNEGAFAATMLVPDVIVRRCYKMLRGYSHGAP